MSKLEQTENINLYRDKNSSALINTNKVGFLDYKMTKQKSKELSDLKKKVEDIDIKLNLILELLKK